MKISSIGNFILSTLTASQNSIVSMPIIIVVSSSTFHFYIRFLPTRRALRIITLVFAGRERITKRHTGRDELCMRASLTQMPMRAPAIKGVEPSAAFLVVFFLIN
jgi:hypothetical protein